MLSGALGSVATSWTTVAPRQTHGVRNCKTRFPASLSTKQGVPGRRLHHYARYNTEAQIMAPVLILGRLRFSLPPNGQHHTGSQDWTFGLTAETCGLAHWRRSMIYAVHFPSFILKALLSALCLWGAEQHLPGPVSISFARTKQPGSAVCFCFCSFGGVAETSARSYPRVLMVATFMSVVGWGWKIMEPPIQGLFNWRSSWVSGGCGSVFFERVVREEAGGQSGFIHADVGRRSSVSRILKPEGPLM